MSEPDCRTVRAPSLSCMKSKSTPTKSNSRHRSIADSTSLTALHSPGTPVHKSKRQKSKLAPKGRLAGTSEATQNASVVVLARQGASACSAKKSKVKKRAKKSQSVVLGITCGSSAPVQPLRGCPEAATDHPRVACLHASVQTDADTLRQTRCVRKGHAVADHRPCTTMQPDPVTRAKLDEALRMALSSKQTSAAPSPDMPYLVSPAAGPPSHTQALVSQALFDHSLPERSAATSAPVVDTTNRNSHARSGTAASGCMMANYCAWDPASVAALGTDSATRQPSSGRGLHVIAPDLDLHSPASLLMDEQNCARHSMAVAAIPVDPGVQRCEAITAGPCISPAHQDHCFNLWGKVDNGVRPHLCCM